MTTEAADILEQAADLLETVGHCKGFSRAYSKGGHDLRVIGYCATGALREMADKAGSYLPLVAAHEALAARLPADFCPDSNVTTRIITWNDAHVRTPSEVIDLMKETAKDLRNG